MKKILLLLLLIVTSFHGFSQTPGISYQAVILNPNIKELPGANAQTSILANSNVAVRFTVMNESYEQEYQEFHLTKTDAYGMINLLIGHGTRINGSYFEDILWNGLSKKLKIDIDFSGTGNSFSLLTEQELTFMPQPALDPDYQAILDNRTNILAEAERATNAESVIKTHLDTNEAASILANTILQTNIDQVQTDIYNNEVASILADETLQTNIVNVQTDIDNNEAVSVFADTELQANIDANAVSTTTAMEVVQTEVDNNETASILADETLQTNIVNVQTDVDANKSATQAALDLKANLDSPSFTGTVSGVNKDMVGLGKVDNTSDVNKPVSTATQIVLDLKVDTVTGKGLSTEDYTTAEKTKLGAIVGVNTGDQDISGIVTNTSNIGDLTNLTTTDNENLVAAINEIDLEKANLQSPTLTGTPLAPSATAGTNTTQIATTAFVGSAIYRASASNRNYVTLNTTQQITGAKTFPRKINLFAQSYANTATMNIGFAPNGENLSSIAMGINAAYSHKYGARVIAIGNEALYNDLRGSDNIGIGSRTLYNMKDVNNDWGNGNVAIGSNSGTNIIQGDNNTLIGTNTNTSTSFISNSTAIGYLAVVNANNTIQLGNTSVTLVNTSGAITSGRAITGVSIVKAGGTSSQFLMADGSVSSGPSGVVSGSGTSNYLPKFTAASTLGNSSIYDNGTNVGIGTSIPSSMFQIGGEGTNDLNLKFDAVSNSSSALKFGYRNFQWRLKMNTNSGTLDPLVFSYFNGTTDITRLTLTNSGLNIPNNLNVTGNTMGSNASFSGNLLVNTNQLSVNTTTNRVGVFTSSPTSMFQVGDNDQFTNQLKYDYGGSVGTLKFGFRNNEFRMKTLTNSGVLRDLIFSYYDNSLATDVESMRISNTGLITINNFRISGGSPAAGKVLTSDANGTATWVTSTSSPIREIADEFSAEAYQTSFTLAQIPSANSKVKMYVNGIRISKTAFVMGGATLNYNSANNGNYDLIAGDRIQMDYYY